MKKLLYLLLILPFLLFSNDKKIPSNIKEVTVYLNGAQITRTSTFNLESGTTEIKFTGLSPKIDESSIQLSGLQSVSVLSMSFGVNYIDKLASVPGVTILQEKIKQLASKIVLLKNRTYSLQEEELLLSTNRKINSTTEVLDLEKLKQISAYYRKRITAIRDEIFNINDEINTIAATNREQRLQLKELTKGPAVPQGELVVKFDAPIAITMNIILSYLVADAGWVPTYDIKSEAIHSNIQLKYKAHIYQNTGNEWKNVKISLSTGNPVKRV